MNDSFKKGFMEVLGKTMKLFTMAINRWKLDADFVLLTLRLLMSYIYGAPILHVSRSHTTTQHSR